MVQPEDVTSLLSIKLALKFAQLRDVESMRAIALAHQNRNLAEFETALRDYKQGTYTTLNLSEHAHSFCPNHSLYMRLGIDPYPSI